MKKYLDIHLEAMDDNGEKLKRILDENVPVAISVCPETLRENGIYKEQYPYLHSRKIINLIGEVVSKPKNILGQQGNIHLCRHEHKFAEPWHENYCLYNKPLNEEEQRELMERGKETLVKLLGKTPEMYVPPNHMFDMTTLDVANKMRYPFFAMKGVECIRPLLYSEDGINTLVISEVKLGEQGNFHYTHYDEISKNKKSFNDIARNSDSFHWIGVDFSIGDKYFSGHKINTKNLAKDIKKIRKNIKATNRKKLFRDAIKFPKRILR